MHIYTYCSIYRCIHTCTYIICMYTHICVNAVKTYVLYLAIHFLIKISSTYCTTVLHVISVHVHWYLQVLKRLGYLSESGVVQHKGKVACNLNTHEVFLTELLYENLFRKFSLEEMIALMSPLVFQQVGLIVYLNFFTVCLQCFHFDAFYSQSVVNQI